MAGGLDLGTLRGKIVLDGKEAEQSLKNVQGQAEQTTKSAQEVGQSMADTGATIAGIGVAGMASLGGLLKVGADLSAEIAGQQFLFKNLDKAVQGTITTNSKLAEEIGLTEQQYLTASTSMATYYQNMGFSAKETSKLSGETMNLVADLGAVTDMPFDEAMDRFKSGLMGNYEALDAFGINVSAASLENSEYVKSLGKSWNQLSDNEKMMAVYNEIQRQGASSTGLAKQEAEQFGMQMKLAKREVYEMAGHIGGALIPIIEPLVAKFRDIVKTISEWVQNNQKLVGIILAVVGVLSTLAVVAGGAMFIFGKITAFFGGMALAGVSLIPIIAGIAGALLLLVGSSDEIRQKLTEGFAIVITEMNSAFYRLMEKLPQWFQMGLDMLLNLVKGLAQAVPNAVSFLFNLLMILINTINANLPRWLTEGKKMVLKMIEGLKQTLPQIIATVGDMILKLLTIIGEKLPVFLKKGVEIVKKLASGIRQNLPEIIGKMVELLGKLIAKIVEYLPKFIAKGLEIVAKLVVGLIKAIPDLLSAGKDLLMAVIDGVKEGIGKLGGVGKDIVNGLLGGIQSAWGSLTSWVGNKLSSINPFKKSVPEDMIGEGGEGEAMLFGTPRGAFSPSLNPALLGASLSRTFRESIPSSSASTSNRDSGGLQEVKETVIHTVVNLDGKQIATASARYMESELEALSNKTNRLGGRVWA